MPDLQRLTVRSAIAPLLSDARVGAPMSSQLLAGDVVDVLERRDAWLRVRGSDDYEGWTHSGYLKACAGDEATWRISLGCQVRDAHAALQTLPLGARVAPDTDLVAGSLIDAEARAIWFPPNGSAIASSAATLYAGASYLWGGVTPWGCDCSGLVQRVLALHGVSLPRDAWQQAREGSAVPGNAFDDHVTGDLLFFSDREDQRVTHVGVAFGAHHMVHSALARGGFSIEDLHSDDAYVARLRTQCVGGRRVV